MSKAAQSRDSGAWVSALRVFSTNNAGAPASSIGSTSNLTTSTGCYGNSNRIETQAVGQVRLYETRVDDMGISLAL